MYSQRKKKKNWGLGVWHGSLRHHLLVVVLGERTGHHTTDDHARLLHFGGQYRLWVDPHRINFATVSQHDRSTVDPQSAKGATLPNSVFGQHVT